MKLSTNEATIGKARKRPNRITNGAANAQPVRSSRQRRRGGDRGRLRTVRVAGRAPGRSCQLPVPIFSASCCISSAAACGVRLPVVIFSSVPLIAVAISLQVGDRRLGLACP